MTSAHDVYAEINPAYCASIITQFCTAHFKKSGLFPLIPVAYLVLPIVLSEDLSSTFDGCVGSTGLLVWLNRSPRIRAGLAQRVNETLEVTTAAIRFGCVSRLLSLAPDGTVLSERNRLPSLVTEGVAGAALKRSKKLGVWCGEAGSGRAVLEAMGLSV